MFESHSRNSRRNKIESALLAIGFGGALVAGAALLWPHREEIKVEPMVIAPIEEPITTSVQVETIQQPTVIEPTTVESKRPLVAIEHQDKETDFRELAKNLIDEGDVRGAFDALRKHLYVNEPSAEVLLQIGRLAGQIKEYAVAEQALLDAAALEPASSEITVERGRILLEAGELAEAREAARQAIRLNRDNASAWNLAGRVAMAESEWQRAETAIRTAVQLEPTDAMLHNNLGLLYVLMRENKDAIDSLETAVELYAGDVPYFVYNNLGLAYEQDSRHDDARYAFESALVANPGYARAQVNLRRVLTTIANLEEAEAQAARTAQAEDEPAEDLIDAPGDEQLDAED